MLEERVKKMINLKSKQIAKLKSLAHHLNPVFQIGKDGINENMLVDLNNYLHKHELMKVSILQNCPQTKEEVALAFEESGIEVVQIIGKTVVLYKQSDEAKNPIILK